MIRHTDGINFTTMTAGSSLAMSYKKLVGAAVCISGVGRF